MKVSEIKNPVSSVTGVGPALTKNLAKLNIFTVGDLLQYYPRDYEDRTKRVSLNQASAFPKIHTVAKIVRHEWFGYGKMKTLKLIVNDGTAQAELICFNRPFYEKSFPAGAIINVHGSFFVKYNALQSSSFEVSLIEKPSVLPLSKEEAELIPKDLKERLPSDNKIIPVYPLTEGVTQKTLSKAISIAISQYARGIENELPEDIIQKRGLLSKQEAIRLIHQPERPEEYAAARKTLSYEELFHFQSVILKRAFRHKGTLQLPPLEENTATARPFVKPEVFLESLSPLQKQFLEKLPFPLTDDQRAVIYEMDSEIDRGYEERSRILNQADRGIPVPKKQAFTMQRLLQGDVGSGKTIVSLISSYAVYTSKEQVALIAPTEALAKQHYKTFSSYLDKLNVKVELLTSSTTKKKRDEILSGLKSGNIDICIGTHSLISSDVMFQNLGFIVFDEQHKFGVDQRKRMTEKGNNPDVLYMTATPIPRTLALTLYNDLTLETIRTERLNKKETKTYLHTYREYMKILDFVRTEIDDNRQAYFVASMIEDDPEAEYQSVLKIKNDLDRYYKNLRIGLLHGKLNDLEKEKVLESFMNHEMDILVSTTVIEVGIDNPNASVMVIIDANKFGLSTIHQLRGRVGRGEYNGYCFLLVKNKKFMERLQILTETNDGFLISEQDLKDRGPGDFLGTEQSGLIKFAYADINKDEDILGYAMEDSLSLIEIKEVKEYYENKLYSEKFD